MQISWNGFGSFTFVAKPVQGDVTFVTNPFSHKDVKFRSLAASLVVQSHDAPDANNVGAIEPEHPEEGRKTFFVHHAGEYEVQGIFVTGIEARKKDGSEHALYRFDAEGIHIAFLGALDRKLSEREVEELGAIDILIVPAGGKDVATASVASEIVAQIEPRIVIPSYVQGEDEYGTADALKRELSCPVEETAKLKITRAQLPEEDMKLFLLSK